MTQQLDGQHLLRHALKTIHIRMHGVIADAAPAFADFSASAHTRKPVEILGHVADVLAFACDEVAAGSFTDAPEGSGWTAEVTRYGAALRALDAAIQTGDVTTEKAERVLQGPIADVLTHVGQLAMLRGMAGQPVPGQNFFVLDLSTLADSGAA